MKTKQMQTKTLYEISKEFSELEFLLDSVEGEITPQQQEQINEFLSGLEEDRDKKVDAYCAVIRELTAKAEIRKRESDRLLKLAKVNENSVKRLKWVLLNFLQTHGVEKIKTDFNEIYRSSNASAPVILDKYFEENPQELEERFRTVSFKPNLNEIGQALRDGEQLDFARFGEKGENLKFK